MITHKQLSLADIFSDCQNIFDIDKPEFLSLFDQTINFDEIVLRRLLFYISMPILEDRALILFSQYSKPSCYSLFSLSLLIIFLKFSRELRDFCGFSSVPDTSGFTRFK